MYWYKRVSYNKRVALSDRRSVYFSKSRLRTFQDQRSGHPRERNTDLFYRQPLPTQSWRFHLSSGKWTTRRGPTKEWLLPRLLYRTPTPRTRATRGNFSSSRPNENHFRREEFHKSPTKETTSDVLCLYKLPRNSDRVPSHQ